MLPNVETYVFELQPPARPLVLTSQDQKHAASLLNELFVLVGKRWPSMG